MSGDTRPVPTNLDGWVGVTDLLVPYKHILHVLWSAPPSLVTVIGVGRPGIIEHLCGAARQDEPVIVEALRELHRRGLIVLDEQTREVAIRRWCRFHKFNGRWAIAARAAFDKIESPVIKSVLVRHEGVNGVFPEKSKDVAPNSNCNVNVNEVAAPQRADARCSAAEDKREKQGQRRRGDDVVRHGVEVWTPADAEGLQALVSTHGAMRVEEIASGLAPALGHRAPYLSVVMAAFQTQQATDARMATVVAHQEQLAAAAVTPHDPVAHARGLSLLPETLRNRVLEAANGEGAL